MAVVKELRRGEAPAPRPDYRREPTEIGSGVESEDGGGEERWRWRQTRRCGSYGDGMVVMAVEPSCEGRRGPAHGTIKVSGRRSACSVLSTSFHTRWFEPYLLWRSWRQQNQNAHL